MTRLTREQSREQTRQRLLAAASWLFARDGYIATSVDRIAEEAGFSKGAFYSNFDTKEAIFLQVLEDYGRASLDALLERLEAPLGTEATIEIVAGWADACSHSGNWSLLVLEYARQASLSGELHHSLERVLRSHWRRLGERLARLAPCGAEDAELLGAMIYELAYAPAMPFISGVSSGDLVRLALKGLFARHPA